MDDNRPHLVIIGGGITGLSAAFYAKKRLEAAGARARLTLLEPTQALGGKIHTLERDGFFIEKGPDSFLARKRPIIELTRDLGLMDELTGTNPQAKKTFIVRGGKLHRIPQGLSLGIPTEVWPFVQSGLISPAGKARAALDLLLPRRGESGDESLGDFFERRLGKEVLEQIAEPLLAGIYAGDLHALSLQATFPQFQAMEKRHRSLILGTLASKKAALADALELPEAVRHSTFLSYRRGLQTLVQGLVAALKDVELRTGEAAASVAPAAGGGIQVALADGGSLAADGVIVTTPTYEAGRLLAAHVPAAEALQRIEYVSVANIIMAFERSDIPFPLDASGFVVPRREKRTITACTWTSAKWTHTAPADKAVLRCYVGRTGEQEWQAWSDEQLIQKARHDLGELLGLRAEPLFVEVTRLAKSMPQYPVGHLAQVAAFRAELAERLPGVLVTGAGFHGVGLPDCIRQGREAAEQLVDSVLTARRKSAAVPV
ncbi:protoporphyrinogen oxidase [Paenibacillus athensensis]|nr:protoporphyrinogen oxidase [Paenibacillus athensensis]MCD1258164.1 protoporphyrinogen oxidase [Paenibacillus athensensis]